MLAASSMQKQMEKRMKTFKSILLFVLLGMLIAACGPKTTPFALQFNNPYAPQPGDSNLMVGDI